MSRFDRRWRECVRRARQASPRPLPEPPADLTRLVRRGSVVSGTDDPELTEWWRWYGSRGLAVATAILVGCVAFVIRDGSEAPSLRPGVEDAVAEVLWRL